MTEKNNEVQNIKKERFEFVLTINGNIVCQRYFKINDFNEDSVGSTQIVEVINYCVGLIKNDLNAKSRLYNWYSAPQTFKDKEEMDRWVSAPTFKLTVPSYIVLADTKEIFVWDGEKALPVEKQFSLAEYVPSDEPETPCVLKFAFLDNGREVCSRIWDGNDYPRFIRSNIDLSNQKNKYKADGVWAPVEASMVDTITKSQPDLIPIIVREICKCCSYKGKEYYNTTVKYGDTTYDLNYRATVKKYYRDLNNKYRKKTEEYLKSYGV